MSTRIYRAVMHATVEEPDKVIVIGGRVDQGVYGNPMIFVTTPITKVLYEAALLDAKNAEDAVKNGSTLDTSDRNTKVAKLFKMLSTRLLPYVNDLFLDDKPNLLLSGFDVSNDPTPHVIPDKPVIKRIDNGKEAHSAKVLLAKITSPLSQLRDDFTYYLYMSSDPTFSEASYVLLFTTTSKFKLIAKGLTRGKEVAFGVAVSNRAGKSAMSEPVKFMPS